MDADASPSLFSFAFTILACLAWVVLVGTLLPRLLGRSLAFLGNRFFHDASHVSIPSLYIYPLSGRIVAHSVRYTIPNATISIEELVLQCRWWRKVFDVHFRQLLTIDDPHTLDPVAAEQQAIERENAAFFVRRFWYRLRRWWHRTAVTTDPNNSVEPSPLISLICVGLRARIINDEKNYALVSKVLDLARANARRSAQYDRVANTETQPPLNNEFDSSHPSALSEASSSTYLSVESIDGKPWQHRILEFVSLRISDGGFYFCDMGVSPLVRLSVNSAKLRYRYGAAACSADECRKRIRIRVSGLRLGVSTQQAVEKIVQMPYESSSHSTQVATEPAQLPKESNTDKMIRRTMLMGHKGFTTQIETSNSQSHSFSSKGSLKRRRAPSVIPRLTNIYIGTKRVRKARMPQALPCSEVINASTAIIDYVFEEPGFEQSRRGRASVRESRDIHQEGSSDTSENLPAPVCRVSILLRGCSFSYDFQAMADIERVMERFQPVFYDLRSLARKVSSGEAKRVADGIQIEVEATPKKEGQEEGDLSNITTPLITVPFLPKHATWKNLLAMNLSSSEKRSNPLQDSRKDRRALPASRLSIHATRISFRTEVPYHVGVPQKSVLSMKDVGINAKGIVEMPIGSSKTLTASRIIHYPSSWKDEHVVTSEVHISDTEFMYLPDTFRVLDDITTTIRALSRKPESISHFVPFRETTKFIATENYKVVVACSHDNAWQNIHAAEADQYGRMMVCGESGELVIAPSTATEFVQNCAVLSWSLSLPKAVGKLDLPLPGDLFESSSGDTGKSEAELADLVKTGQQKSRTSSIAQFVKTFETFGGASQPQSAPERRQSVRRFAIELLRVGRSFEISGKVVAHERRLFLDTENHAFLDAVNRSELQIRASSLQLDLNPHHMTHIFNLLRNYAGPGLHTLTAEEGSELAHLRLSTARRVLAEGRYPNATECLAMGLPAGFALSSHGDRTALDDMLFVTFHIDEVLVRLHDQPQALSTFHSDCREACSLECKKLQGSISSSRQGLEMSCSPNISKNVIIVTEGHRELRDVLQETRSSQVERIVPPRATISGLKVTKLTRSSEEWGPYTSDLRIIIDCVEGCISDSSIARIARFSSNVIPDALHEDSLAVAAMLSVENLEVQLSSLDLLVLSASSASSWDRSGRMKNFFSLGPLVRNEQPSQYAIAPKLLSSVTQVQLPSGLRFVMSDLALEDVATRSRVLLPNISIDVLMLWGGQLIRWVDDVTMRAQVTHAATLRRTSPDDGIQERGVLHSVGRSEGMWVDLNYDSRPLLWSTRVSARQRLHVARMRRQIFKDLLPSDSPYSEEEQAKQRASSPSPSTQEGCWRTFLDQAYKASDIEKHIDRKARTPHSLDYLSVSVLTEVIIFLTPESIQIANDVITRSGEALSFKRESLIPTAPVSGEDMNQRISVSDIVELWREFERRRKSTTATTDTMPLTSMKAIETKGVEIVLSPPVFAAYGRDHDPFLSKMQTEDVKLSAPLGIRFLHLSKTDTPDHRGNQFEKHQQSIDQSLHTTLVCINHASIPSVEIRCNGKDLVDVSGMAFTFRQTVKPVEVDRATAGNEGFVSHVRSNRVGRIASLKVGSKNSELNTYACLGRVLSMFVLMFRTLHLEVSALLRLRKNRIAELCGLVFGVPEEKLMKGELQFVRNFFVHTIRFLDPSREGGNDTTNSRTSDSPKFRIPQTILKNTSEEKKTSHYCADSIDLSIYDFSLKAASHAVLKGDFFQCTGGHRGAPGMVNHSLHGHVLSASFGTIWLSVRDDLASDALRMVSDVASCVRTAAISMSMIEDDTRDKKQSELESSDTPWRGLSGETRFRAAENDFLTGSRRRPGRLLKNPGGLTIEAASRRRDNPLRGNHGSLRSNNNLAYGRAVNIKEIAHEGQDPRCTLISKDPSRLPKDLANTSKSTTVPARNQTSSFPERNPNVAKRRKPTQKTFAEPLFGLSLDQEITDQQRSEEETNHNSLLLNGNNGDSKKIATEDGYAYIAIRTAGESGPPLKRAKSMVRLGTLVPPAFSSSTTSVPLSRTDRDLIGNRVVTTSPSDVRRESASVIKLSRPVPPEVAIGATKAPTRMTTIRHQEPKQARSSITLFVSCHRIACSYHSGKGFHSKVKAASYPEADIRFFVSEPRLTYMSSPQKGSHSIVITSSSAEVKSANDPNCILTGAIEKIGLKMSIDEGYVPTKLPKLIMSGQVSELTTTLHATDLQSVLTFRENFKKDIKGILSAFLRTKQSLSEVARVIKMSSAESLSPERTVFSTLAFDLLCERSKIKLEGFHPEDSAMTVSYLQDGMFFSVVASEDDKAALTLGLRLYGHGLSISSPSWESGETLRFPSVDARGVQWGEATGLPTIVKVTTEPLMNSTSVQGLRHVLFTVAGLMAFQNVSGDPTDLGLVQPPSPFLPLVSNTQSEKNPSPSQVSGAPFTRSFAAWERTKGVRMDISIRPMSISLASGQVLALFDVDTLTGIFEWNKLVLAGVQLQMAVSVPRISLSFMRMQSSEFTIADARLSEKRTSLSIALERSRIDLLKTQEDLTHTFTFRIDVFAVSGQVRPWKLLLDAASWADEQEFVAELQAINYQSLSSAKQRQPRGVVQPEIPEPIQHRVILFGANLQRFILAVPLVSTEEYASSRLALRATDLNCFSRQRLHGTSPAKSVMELKAHFIGILWENSPLLSTHHAKVAFRIHRPSIGSTAHFGDTSVVMYPGSWRICPRKDVVLAIIEAKNRKDNRKATEKTRELLAALPDITSYPASSTAGDSVSFATDKQNRLLFENLRLKTFRTSGFIEGLDQGTQPMDNLKQRSLTGQNQVQPVSKLSVPAFSVSIVRNASQCFDIIDVDFSGREGGEFPRGCLGKVSHLLSDLFGAVTADQMNQAKEEKTLPQIENTREMTRDVSVLIRFGRSLYRAQEAINPSMEAKFGFFAGKSSSILISLYTSTVLEDEGSHSTVITGISPRLGLEITPLLSGAKVQSLRLTDARFLHGISPSRPPHTVMHINRVTALMEAKTLLLTKSRLGSLVSRKAIAPDAADDLDKTSSPMLNANRKFLFLLGKARVRRSFDSGVLPDGKEYRVEPDIRLQMKFPANDDSAGDEVDLFVERCILGMSSEITHALHSVNRANAYAGFHKVILRAQWDLLGCKLQLREALFCYGVSDSTERQYGQVSISTILNRLQFESMQYGRNTAKVDVNAVAAMWAVPGNELFVESTSVHAEVAYTLQNAKSKLAGQAKKLKNEVKLLTEKDLSRKPQRRDEFSYEGTKFDSALNGEEAFRDIEGIPDYLSKSSGPKSSRSDGTLDGASVKGHKRLTRTVHVKGDDLVVTMRGYQFDEARQSAEIGLSGYDLRYRCGTGDNERIFHRYLNIDFHETRLSYFDEDRGIKSDLFRIPSPKLKLSITENESITKVDLQGILLIALKHGFYYIQDFKNLAELTVMGIVRSTPDTADSLDRAEKDDQDTLQVWNGNQAKVTVNLNPKIDVMGDLTEDMLHMNMIASRLGKAEVIPRQMYDFVILPLEAVSDALCGPLYR